MGYVPPMPSILSSVRGAVVHTIWYLDWRTGGTTVVEARQQPTS
jgi:hypothetical protein